MNDHLNGWLEAYHDGQLEGGRARKVEAHLTNCPSCQAELHRLGTLRGLLRESPDVETSLPAERFVAQVGLQLPRRSARPAWQRSLASLWGLVPVVLLAIWTFFETLLISTILTGLALDLGVWTDLPAGLTLDSQPALWDAGLLSLVTSALIGILLLAWVASWWIRKQANALPEPTEQKAIYLR